MRKKLRNRSKNQQAQPDLQDRQYRYKKTLLPTTFNTDLTGKDRLFFATSGGC
jgi:hypothetical protein